MIWLMGIMILIIPMLPIIPMSLFAAHINLPADRKSPSRQSPGNTITPKGDLPIQQPQLKKR
jgi:hypothetical protein